MTGQTPLIVIVGPTAVGKTAISLQLAQALNAEIISADSRQIYRGMDIGTAKASRQEQAQTPHHLIDIVSPDETLTLAQFQRLACRAIDDIRGRGRLPLLVGGTGQYVRAVIEGWDIPEIAPQPRLRAALQALDGDELARWLQVLDPDSAIDPRNLRRVIRALEVALLTGRPMSALQRKAPPPWRILQLGLTLPRPLLYERIDARVDRMLAAGLLAETQRLAESFGWRTSAMSGLGYWQLGAFLRGESSLEEAVQQIKRHTRRLVRHQANWFKPDDPAIRWFDAAGTSVEILLAFVQDWLVKEAE